MVIIMKKIFAILIGFLLLGTVFGVASVMATICELPSFSSVQVGDTFTLKNTFEPCGDWEKYIEAKSLGGGIYQFKAIKTGKVTFNCGSCGGETATVTILPREYPMFSFLKILGFGKEK